MQGHERYSRAGSRVACVVRQILPLRRVPSEPLRAGSIMHMKMQTGVESRENVSRHPHQHSLPFVCIST